MFTMPIKSANLSLVRANAKPRRRSLKGKRIITFTDADLKRADEISATLKAFGDAQKAANEKAEDVLICAASESQYGVLDKPIDPIEKTADTTQSKLQRIAERAKKRRAEKQVEKKENN